MNTPTSPLKSRHITMIGLGGAIGAGLFVGSSSSISQTGPAVIFSFLATSILVFLVMRMLGEMVIAKPGRGSFVEYIRAGNGDKAAFVSGWLYWFFWVSVVGSEAIAGAVIMDAWVPLPIWILAILIVSLIFIFNMGAVHIFGEVEFWLSSIKVLSIILFIIVCSGYLLVKLFYHSTSNLTVSANFEIFPMGFSAAIAAIPSALFTMLGAELGTVAAGESDAPQQEIARVTRGIGIRISIFYLASLLLILLIVPWQSIKSGYSPFVSTLEIIGIPGASFIMKCVVLAAILSCLNSSMYITSRVLHELSSKGDAPQILMAQSRYGTPTAALVFSAIFGIIIAFSSIISPNIMFSFIINCSGGVVLIVYGMIAIAHFYLRNERKRPKNNYFLINFSVVTAIFFVFLVMMFSYEQRLIAISSIGTAILFLLIAMMRKITWCKN